MCWRCTPRFDSVRPESIDHTIVALEGVSWNEGYEVIDKARLRKIPIDGQDTPSIGCKHQGDARNRHTLADAGTIAGEGDDCTDLAHVACATQRDVDKIFP